VQQLNIGILAGGSHLIYDEHHEHRVSAKFNFWLWQQRKVSMERLSKKGFWRGLFVALAFVGCLQAQTLKQIAAIDLPGPKGERFDYLTMDDEDHYLLSAHLGT
jgi:hypothetical protein